MMKTMVIMKRGGGLVAVLMGLAVLVPRPARAVQQTTPPPSVQAPAAPAEPPPISVGQLQALFDAYTIVQAQTALDLSDAQYGVFIARLKALQETRRRHQQARQRILADLRKLTNPQTGTGDDATVGASLKALKDEDASAATDVRTASDAVDQVLTVHQQARFRIFEERMEQQKLDLVMRARQAARGRGRAGG